MFDTLRQTIHDTLERHRQQPFLEAAMAACALVAMADGEISLSERTRVDDILEAIDRLSLFDVHDAVDRFNAFAEAIRADPKKGRMDALDAVAEMADDTEAADLLVRVCLAVSEADGEYAPGERDQIVAVCGRLGLTLSDYENRA